MVRALALLAMIGLASGCGGAVSVPPMQFEPAQRCEWTGGWWRPDELLGGFCEYQAPGFI